MQNYGCCFIPVVSTKTQTIKAIKWDCVFVENGLSFVGFGSLTLTWVCFSSLQLVSEVLSWHF